MILRNICGASFLILVGSFVISASLSAEEGGEEKVGISSEIEAGKNFADEWNRLVREAEASMNFKGSRLERLEN